MTQMHSRFCWIFTKQADCVSRNLIGGFVSIVCLSTRVSRCASLILFPMLLAAGEGE